MFKIVAVLSIARQKFQLQKKDHSIIVLNILKLIDPILFFF